PRLRGLGNYVLNMLAGLANIQRLTHTYDRRNAVGQSCRGPLRYELIRFIVVSAALRVAYSDVGAAKCSEHGGGYATGVYARIVARNILITVGDLQVVAFHKRLCRTNIGKRMQEGDIYFFVVFLGQSKGELLQLSDSLLVVEVHLPVASNQWGARHLDTLPFKRG